MCRDEAGVGLLHKAVFYDFMDIAEYLVKNYPQLVHMKDSVSLQYLSFKYSKWLRSLTTDTQRTT